MTSLKPFPWQPETAPHPWTHPVRRMVAASLSSTSAALAKMAQQLALPAVTPASTVPSVLEFHAEAGAPEGGALYLDGRLVGYLPGVYRL